MKLHLKRIVLRGTVRLFSIKISLRGRDQGGLSWKTAQRAILIYGQETIE
jgi:hypothetical protein